MAYDAQFPKALGPWDFEIASKYTSPNFTINFFGYGNETFNDDETKGMDYNRVRLRTLAVTPTLKKKWAVWEVNGLLQHILNTLL